MSNARIFNSSGNVSIIGTVNFTPDITIPHFNETINLIVNTVDNGN